MRKVAKCIAGVLFSGVILMACEFILRVAVGPPTPELVATLPGGEGELIRRSGEGIQPAYQDSRKQSAVSAERLDGKRRVLWVGGSSIHGGTQGIAIAEEAPGRLAALLGVESVNFGGIGMDTISIGAILDDALSIQPDVLVVYSGHNEFGNAVFTGRYGDAQTARLSKIRARLGASRLYQFLEMAIRGRETMALPSAATEGQFTVDAARRTEVYRRYEERLRHIVGRASAAGVPVVLVTLMSNPVAPSIEFSCPEAVKRAGFTAVRPEALAVDGLRETDLAAAEQLAPGCADLRWIRARRAGDRAALDALRDADPLPVRADSTLNGVVRRVAAETGATLVDADGFARMAGNGLEPSAWFLDPMHFTIAGHDALARMVAQGVAPLLALRPPPLAPSPSAELDLAGCAAEGCRERRDF